MNDAVAYWSRAGGGMALWGLLALGWWLGGWLLASHAFRLPRRERWIVGLGLGLVCSLWFTNILARLLPYAAAVAGASALTLALGLAFALPGRRPLLRRGDLWAWPVLGAGVALGWAFVRIGQGLAIFDEYVHLPLISTLAAGNVPPQHFANATEPFTYHYGFHLLGASLMQPGGLFPWSAFDLSKGILWGLALVLAYFLGRRLTRSPWGGALVAALVALAGGTRYLALLLPGRALAAADPLVALRGGEATLGPTLGEALLQPWPLDGGPPFPYPLAFLPGVGRPLVMAHAGLNVLNAVLLLLVWLVIGRTRDRASWLVVALLLAQWALTWETSYVLFALGVLAAGALALWRRRQLPRGPLAGALVATFGSLLVALVQGGVLTELVRAALTGEGGGGLNGETAAAAAAGFFVGWPPTLVSAHLGRLPLTSPAGLLMALLEAGPVLLFAPWITLWAWRRFHSGSWLTGALLAGAWLGVLLPLVLRYRSDTDLPRLTEHGLLVMTILLAAMLWRRDSVGAGWRSGIRYLAPAALGLAAMGGAAQLGISLTAAARPIIAHRFSPLDAQVARAAWDQLPPEGQVFDSEVWRATALTGRLTRALTGGFSFGNQLDPEWQALRAAPAVPGFLEAGYAFVYVDERWWRKMPGAGRESLTQPCVVTLTEVREASAFRRLLDLRKCVA